MDSLFLEIFGCEDAKAPVEKAATALPMDSPLYPYSPDGGAADSLCDKLENAALTAEILGPTQTVFRPSAKRGEVVDELPHLDFAKAWAQGQRTLERIREAAPDRQRQIELLIRQSRATAPKCAQAEGWGDLQVACVKFIEAAILSA